MKNKIYGVVNSYDDDFDYLGELYVYLENEKNIIMGDNHWKGFNDDIIDSIEKCFDEYYYCDNNNCIKYYYDNTTKLLNTYLPKSNNKKWSPCEVATFKKLYSQWLDSYKSGRGEIYARILSMYFKEKMQVKYLHGCCQGECVCAIFTENTSDEVISDIEALYFGYGHIIDFVDSDEKIDNIDDIFSSDDRITIFTSKYNTNAIKKLILENYTSDYTIDDILLYEAKPYNVVKYDYKLLN